MTLKITKILTRSWNSMAYPSVSSFFSGQVRVPALHHQVFSTPNSLFSSSSASYENKPAAEGLIITDACVKQMKKIGRENEFLRVTVEGGGCSGFTYKFKLDTELEDDDCVFERDDVKVVTDEISLDLIKGSQIDYAEELIRSAFRLNANPQSKNSCSCGVSFSID